MPTKIRLQRKGKKAQPFYHIVIADGRAPRDGKYIERIGTYNPLTKPADINLKFERALHWLQVGAQPTDTVRTILSYKGVLYKNHLLNGVKKGALTQEQADAKFDGWLKEKEEKIAGSRKEIISAEKDVLKKRFEAEKKVNEERAKELAAKRLAEMKAEEDKKAEEEAEKEEATDEAAAEATPEAAKEVASEPKAEAPAEEPVKEEVKEDVKKEEVKEEPKKEEQKEEVKEETKEEAKEEEKAEEKQEEKKVETKEEGEEQKTEKK